MENALLKISEDGKAIIHIIKFFDENKKEKCTFIIPYIHPGPFGNIGSSNMPKIFHDNIKNSFCFHGSCSHQLNLIVSKDVYKIADEINKINTKEIANDVLNSQAKFLTLRKLQMMF